MSEEGETAMSIVMKGAAAAAALTEENSRRAQVLLSRGLRPKLAIVRVGNKANNLSYEKNAIKRCASAGVETQCYALPEEVPQEELEQLILQINRDDSVHGCLLLRPLPASMDEGKICSLLSPEKDVDGITHASISGVYTDSGEGYPPCTAKACMVLLRHYGIPIEGKRVVVLGRSLVIGKPVAMLLLGQNATVTLCHSKSENLRDICRQADILIAAAGQREMLDRSYLRCDGSQCVIDVGIHVRENGRLCGDVAYDDVADVVGAITPVPGGVGAVTTSILVEHLLTAAERKAAR